MVKRERLGSIVAVLGLAAVGIGAMPHEAKAWWRGGFGYGVWGPPIVVAPPVYAPRVYAPPPVAYVAPPPAYYPPGYYPGPRRAWVPPTGRARIGCAVIGTETHDEKIQGDVIDEAANKAHG